MRVDVRKWLFIGALPDKERFLEEAQRLGVIEFINPQGKRLPSVPPEADRYFTAIKTLRGFAMLRQEHQTDLHRADHILDTILSLRAQREEAEEALTHTRQEIERIAPFGHFDEEELRAIERDTHRTARFYCAKSSKQLDTLLPSLMRVSSQQGIDYFLALTTAPLANPDLIEMHISEPLPTLERRVQALRTTISHTEEQLKSLTRYNELMHYALAKRLDHIGLTFATSSTEAAADNALFLIQGWVPVNKLHLLDGLTQPAGIYAQQVAIEHSDVLPTYLENHGPARLGEMIVQGFDYPSAKDKDPSIWVLAAFALFFAMIVGDAGYGLVFLATACLIQWRRRPQHATGRRVLALLTMLGGACLVWGLLTNSFFGVELSPNNPLRKHSLITYLLEKKAAYHMALHDDVYTSLVETYPVLRHADTVDAFLNTTTGPHSPTVSELFARNLGMEFALAVGVLHILCGLLRYCGRTPQGLGWAAFIVGGYLCLPAVVHATTMLNFLGGIDPAAGAAFGRDLLLGGIVFATVVSIIRNGFTGVFEITMAIQVFGDVMSYLRIYALGLAGAIMASTMNGLALKLPLFFTLIMLLCVHAVNITLAIMGGVIHGLRLNFLEWYHYAFEGGGRKFRPLALHTLD